jgi:predicted transcriptional regulator
MIQLSVFLEPDQLTALRAIAARHEEPVSSVARRALEDFIARSRPEGRLERLRSARGLWKAREPRP